MKKIITHKLKIVYSLVDDKNNHYSKVGFIRKVEKVLNVLHFSIPLVKETSLQCILINAKYTQECTGI